MGTCSSSLKTKRIKKKNAQDITKAFNKEKILQKTILKSKLIRKTFSQEFEEDFNDLAQECLGYLVGSKKDMQGKTQKDIIGLGCVISKTTLFVSDHYSYIYAAEDLQFHPFYHEQQDKAITIVQTIFPQNITKEKKNSMYLHKRLGIALYELSQPINSSRFFKLGINILAENSQEPLFEEIVQKLIHQSSRLYFSITQDQLLEKGWPLLHKLYDEYYCIGIFSNMNATDYILLNDKIAARLQSSQQKHLGVDTIQVIQICESVAEIVVVDRNRSFIPTLEQQLQTARIKSDKIQCAELLFRIAVEYGTRGQLQRQMKLYLEALNLYSTQKDDHLQNIAQLYHNIGLCLSEQGLFLKAQKYLLQALQVKKKINPCGRSQSIGDTLNELGVNSKNQDKLIQSNLYYNQALEIYRSSGSSQKEHFVLNNMNLLRQGNQNHSKNMEKLGQTLISLIKIKGENCIQVAKIYFNLSLVERESKNYGSSLTFLCKSMNIMKNLGLQKHFQYEKIAKELKSIKCEIEEYNLKRQWALKAAGMIKMI